MAERRVISAEELLEKLRNAPPSECANCGFPYKIWMARDDLWWKFGIGDGFLCLNCFVVRAERLGKMNGLWKLTLE